MNSRSGPPPRARPGGRAEREQAEAIAKQRRQQVGTAERSEKIRTYNYPQNRVTDHRIGLSLHRLEVILDGDLDQFIDTLTAADQAAQLARGGGPPPNPGRRG